MTSAANLEAHVQNPQSQAAQKSLLPWRLSVLGCGLIAVAARLTAAPLDPTALVGFGLLALLATSACALPPLSAHRLHASEATVALCLSGTIGVITIILPAIVPAPYGALSLFALALLSLPALLLPRRIRRLNRSHNPEGDGWAMVLIGLCSVVTACLVGLAS